MPGVLRDGNQINAFETALPKVLKRGLNVGLSCANIWKENHNLEKYPPRVVDDDDDVEKNDQDDDHPSAKDIDWTLSCWGANLKIRRKNTVKESRMEMDKETWLKKVESESESF